MERYFKGSAGISRTTLLPDQSLGERGWGGVGIRQEERVQTQKERAGPR